MAFSSVIRRTASFVAPLAIRILETRRYYHPPLFSVVNGNSGFREALCRSGAHFSSAAERPESDVTLLRDLESSIKCAEESYDDNRVEEIPGGFPFSLQDNPGTRYITLGREYDDETIEVKVRLSDHVTGDDDNDARPSIPLVVKVFKEDMEDWLEFRCTAYPLEVSIDGLAVREPEVAERYREAQKTQNPWVPPIDVAYKGPDFSSMDKNLRKAFDKYLEIRGFNPSTANFLHDYMTSKRCSEYLLWLEDLKDFIERKPSRVRRGSAY